MRALSKNIGRGASVALVACFAGFGVLHAVFPAGAGTTLGLWTATWPALRWIHPALLIATGAGLAFPRSRVAALYATIGLLSAFTGLLAVDLWQPMPRGCGCVPALYPAVTAALNSPVGGMARNAVLLAMALTSLGAQRAEARPG